MPLDDKTQELIVEGRPGNFTQLQLHITQSLNFIVSDQSLNFIVSEETLATWEKLLEKLKHPNQQGWVITECLPPTLLSRKMLYERIRGYYAKHVKLL